MSSRGETETRWYVDGPLTEEGRKELLKRFGLESVADQLPLETIATMSPAQLAYIGNANGQVQSSPVSDRIGDHCSAELVAA